MPLDMPLEKKSNSIFDKSLEALKWPAMHVQKIILGQCYGSVSSEIPDAH